MTYYVVLLGGKRFLRGTLGTPLLFAKRRTARKTASSRDLVLPMELKPIFNKPWKRGFA